MVDLHDNESCVKRKETNMNDNINYQFNKHYGRLIEDLKQIKGFTPVMEKVISVNVEKLHEDIENELTKGENNDKEIYTSNISTNG